MTRILSFAPTGLYKKYIQRIQDDTGLTRPTELLNHIVSEYIVMKYGDEVRKEIRREYIEQEIGF